MISFTSAQAYAWLTTFMWPLFRILGLIATEPILGNRVVPRRVKVGFALLVTLVVAPLLPPVPGADPISPVGIMIAIQQILIGVSMGFAIRVVVHAVEMAGQLTGLQMGLGFAVFFDPQSAAQTAVVGQFTGLLATLVLLSTNAHYLIFSALVESFNALPISSQPLAAAGFGTIVQWGGEIFSVGVQMSLPVIAALLVTNLGIGIMTRAAPQLNIFAVGFPLTLGVGFVVLYLAVPFMAPMITQLSENAVAMALKVVSRMHVAQ
jgi:flagellar biosynthesis protein FliR